jgi:hypothetical protein
VVLPYCSLVVADRPGVFAQVAGRSVKSGEYRLDRAEEPGVTADVVLVTHEAPGGVRPELARLHRLNVW